MKTECNKIPFNSEKEAYEELHRIVEDTNFKPWKKSHKKPSRCYLCKKCEGNVWHLTSSPTVTEY